MDRPDCYQLYLAARRARSRETGRALAALGREGLHRLRRVLAALGPEAPHRTQRVLAALGREALHRLRRHPAASSRSLSRTGCPPQAPAPGLTQDGRSAGLGLRRA
jgi:hypothetical protein